MVLAEVIGNMIHRNNSEEKFQIDALDGVRGLAALIVVFSHTSNKEMYFFPFLDFRGIGKSGVFAFFILSAFLLTTPLLQSGKRILSFESMSHYWQRRFFRIYPLYSIYLFGALASTWFFSFYFDRKMPGVPFSLDLLSFIRHLFLAEGKSVTWSIAVEFKFYFFLPFMAYGVFLIKKHINQFGILIFVLAVALTQIVSPQSASLSNDTSLLPYMVIFIFGIAIAVFQQNINFRGLGILEYQAMRLLGFVGAAGLILMSPSVFSTIGGEDVPSDFFHRQFVAYAMCWSLVIISAINVDGSIKSFFCMQWLRFFGAISFSLYLFHPIFIQLAKVAGIGGVPAAWFVLLGATAAAYLSFRYLEEPISRFKLGRLA